MKWEFGSILGNKHVDQPGGPARAAQHLGAYRPVALVIAALALLIALLPSVDQDEIARQAQVGDGTVGVPQPVTEDTAPRATSLDGAPASPRSGQRDSAGAINGGGDAAPGANPTPRAGSTTHCVNGRQFTVLILNPPCYPAFTGDNGGATSVGVTSDAVRVMWFELRRNPQVDAILRTQGLSASSEEVDDYYEHVVAFLNANYEFYGREIEFIRFRSSCPETPTDVPLCIEEARRAMEMEPFIIFEASPLYPAVHDEFARAGFISLGGWHFESSFFTQRRPYRYDVFMNGSDTADLLAEFYCKNMAGRGATHSGQVIHPTIGARGTPRKVGFLVQDDDARIKAANRFVDTVNRCNGNEADAVAVKYSTDIERVQENADGLTVKLIEEGVTTVVCSCDTIAPIFLLPAFTGAGYFPEHLLPGSGLSDDDAIGRMFEPGQWVHAFGPSHLGNLGPSADFDQTRAYRAGGGKAGPCSVCRVYWWYIQMIADMIQSAGPNLDAQSIEAGTLGLPDNGRGSTRVPLYRFGPGDYTAWSDMRVVYWDPSARSEFIGNGGGAYIDVAGERYEGGAVPGGLMDRIPVAPS